MEDLPLTGRGKQLDRLVGPAAPAVSVVTGEAGAGRSALLRALADRLTAADRGCLLVRCVPSDQPTGFATAYRIVASADEPPVDRLRPFVAELTGQHGTVAATRRLRAVLARYAGGAVLIDDAQWSDRRTLAALHELAADLAGCRLVLAVRQVGFPDPTVPGVPALDDLVRAGAADVVPLPPLTRADVARMVSAELRAMADHRLVTEVYRLSAGNPLAVRSVLAGHRDHNAIRVVDGHAYLVQAATPPSLDADDRLLAGAQDLGEPAWSVAAALSVLAPLGTVAPAVCAEVVGLPVAEVVQTISRLVGVGVLAGDDAAGWTFRIPLVAATLGARLGPHRRRELAAAAVRALWARAEDGVHIEADTADYLLDRLAEAGPVSDPGRAITELLTGVARANRANPWAAARWMYAAAELMADPVTRSKLFAFHVSLCHIGNRFADAVAGARIVFAEHADNLTPAEALEIEVVYVTALAALGDVATMERLATTEWSALPGGIGARSVARGVALSMLERWTAGRRQLAESVEFWRDDPGLAYFARMFDVGAQAMAGEPGPMFQSMGVTAGDEGEIPERFQVERVIHHGDMRIGWGELRPALDTWSTGGVEIAQLPAHDRFLVSYWRGEWAEAMAVARAAIANNVPMGRPPVSTMMYPCVARMLLAGGRPNSALAVLEEAGTRPAHSRYLVGAAAGDVHGLLGDDARAERCYLDALAEAAAMELVFGTDELLFRLVELRWARGRTEAAHADVAELARVAEKFGTERARVLLLSAHLVIGRDVPDAAAELLALVGKRAQPPEMVVAFTLAARAGIDPARLLPETYELLGELGAPLWRSWLRAGMRAAHIAVPNRRKAAEEGERLLATLVADGQSNKAIAGLLGTTTLAVASQLSRLFTRTGLRSRVELATAVLTGEYPA